MILKPKIGILIFYQDMNLPQSTAIYSAYVDFIFWTNLLINP